MKKVFVLLLFALFVIFAGPKILDFINERFEYKGKSIEGLWSLNYSMMDDNEKTKIEFSNTEGVLKGVVLYDGEIIGKFFREKFKIFLKISFSGISRYDFNGDFTGMISEDNVHDYMSGKFTGNRIVSGMRVETEGEWYAER